MTVPLTIPLMRKNATSGPSAALRVTTRPDVDSLSSLVVAGVTSGISATGATATTNDVDAVSTRPVTVEVTVTVIVVVPLAFAAGVSVRVRVPPDPVTWTFAFGTSVVLLELAVIESKPIAASPTLKVNDSGVSSAVVFAAIASIVGATS